MSEGPTRLTVRGGRDQFDWNNVKDDKHYHNYLGHSLKAPVGRWQKNKDLEWFNKAGASEEDKRTARLEEIRKIKEAEEEAVAVAMGITLPPREAREAAKGDDSTQAAQSDKSDDRSSRRHREHKEHREHRRRDRSRSRSRSRTRHHSRREEDYRRSDRRRSHRSRSRERSSRNHRSRDDSTERRRHR